MFKKSVIICFVILSLFGCSPKMYFTPSVKNQLETYNQPLNQVQFFIDKRITLKNQTLTIDSIGNKTYSTKIIRIKRNTPGLCVSEKDSVLVMQFEQGNTNNLLFGVKSNPKPNDHYKILAFNWSKMNGVIKYEDLSYNISIRDAFATLKIKSSLLKRLEKKEVNRRTIKGFTIEEKQSQK